MNGSNRLIHQGTLGGTVDEHIAIVAHPWLVSQLTANSGGGNPFGNPFVRIHGELDW